MPYLTVERFNDLSVLAEERVQELCTRRPAFLDTQFDVALRSIEDRLRHKYVVPFPPAHPTIEGWIVSIVQPKAALKVGIDPGDPGYVEMVRLSTEVNLELTDASDMQSSRWNLPRIPAQDASAIAKGEPFGYSEASPYDWTDGQWGDVHNG